MFAREIMTPAPRTLFLDDTISDAWRTLDQMAIRHLPVVNASDELVGMLSDRDLVRTSRDSDRPVATLMKTQVVSVRPETSVDLVVKLMLEHPIGAVPVVDQTSKVVGIVSYRDVLRALPGIVAESGGHLH